MNPFSALLRALDAALVALVGLWFGLELAVRRLRRRPREQPERNLLVIDSAYCLATLRARQLERFVTERDLDGFFDHVYTFHPLVGASPDDPSGSAIGGFTSDSLNDHHTMLQARVGLRPQLVRLPLLNFLLSQRDAYIKIDKLVRNEGIRVMRAHDPFYLGLFGWSLAWTNRVRLLVFIQGNYDYLYASTGKLAYPRLLRSRRVEQILSRWILRRADLVAGGNQNNLEYGLANGARPSRAALFRIGNAIESYHFAEPAARSRPEDVPVREGRPFMVYVGRLESLKHPDDVVRAFAVAKNDHPELECVLIGDGSLRDALRELAQELGVNGALHMVGNRSQRWIADLLPQAKVVMAPLVGRSLVEAALSGTPIVAYDIEWHSELIQHETTGLMVQYRDSAAMGHAVARLLQDDAVAKRLGAAAREAAQEMMDPMAIRSHERTEYQRLLDDHTKSPTLS